RVHSTDRDVTAIGGKAIAQFERGDRHGPSVSAARTSPPELSASDCRWAHLKQTERRFGLPGGGDVLRLAELVDALAGAFAAEAGLLHPAERGRRIGHRAAVEADH